MNVVRVKTGTTFAKIQPAGFVILAAVHAATRVLRVDITITCGTEGHPQDDPHTQGEAYDLGTNDYTVDVLLRVRAFLQNSLGPLFTVLYERPTPPTDARLLAIATINAAATAPHLHVQRRKGTVYPPAPPAVKV